MIITELWRARIGDYSDMVETGVDMVVGEAGVRFRGPARFDDVVDFELRVLKLGETSFSSGIDATVDGRTVVEGTMRHVFVETGTNTKRAVPGYIGEALAPLVVDEKPAAAR